MNKNKTLLQKFIEFNAEKRMAGRKKSCLLAVSGGIDSMVMCDLFYKAGFPFAIAHCNFGLRGDESNADARFVKNMANKYEVRVYVTIFDTVKYAEENKISVQLAARELRYAWFEEMRVLKRLDLIATAHQLNDNIETIIFNLTKGTGIRGLRGIPERNGKIIRPLLFASRDEIDSYCRENNLQFREDSSNATNDYTRNKIRHAIIPVMKEINPSLENTFAEKIALFTQLEQLYEKQVRQNSKQLFLQRKDDVYIPILKLKKMQNPAGILFEYLKNYNFNAEQVEDILCSINDVSGKQFITDKARLIKDRRFLILTRLAETNTTIKLIEANDSEIELGERKVKISVLNAFEVQITADKNIAFIDGSQLEFPLVARHWKQGDYFYPFGMKMKKKKLKKFFIEQKMPLNEKENIWVIESGGRIVWVAAYRMDERFKVTEATTEVIKIELM